MSIMMALEESRNHSISRLCRSDGYFAAQIKEDAARRMGIATMRDIFDNCMKMDPNPAKIQIIILQ